MDVIIPTVIEKTKYGEKAYDIYSRLLKNRIVYVGGEISAPLANSIVAQLLFLRGQDKKKDIVMYINSHGGSVADGLAIFDIMNFIEPDVSTVAIGTAASMGAFLLAGGTKGKRYALKNTDMLLHQPLGGAQGQASDIEITAKMIIKTKAKLNKYLAEFTGQPLKKIEEDSDRDYWLSAEEAVSYGLIDKIL